MGIFNEQSANQQLFAKAVQEAPGVGFNLTKDGHYDMINTKLTNVGFPASNADAAAKKYVDDNASGSSSSPLIDSGAHRLWAPAYFTFSNTCNRGKSTSNKTIH